MPSSSSSKDGGKRAGLQVRTYLESLPADVRRVLQKVRETIRAATPGATEGFSYGIPAFMLDGRPLVWDDLRARPGSNVGSRHCEEDS